MPTKIEKSTQEEPNDEFEVLLEESQDQGTIKLRESHTQANISAFQQFNLSNLDKREELKQFNLRKKKSDNNNAYKVKEIFLFTHDEEPSHEPHESIITDKSK